MFLNPARLPVPPPRQPKREIITSSYVDGKTDFDLLLTLKSNWLIVIAKGRFIPHESW